VEGLELFSLARERWHDDSLLAARLMVRYPASVPDQQISYERGLELARKHQDSHEIAFCLRQLGLLLSHSLGNQDGIALMEESAALFESLGESFCLAYVLDDLGWSYRITGKLDLQRARVQRSIDLRREIGDKIGMANALRNMGGALGGFAAGTDEPLHKWLEALQLSREIGDKRNIAWNSFMVGVYWHYQGQREEGQPYLQEAFDLASEIKEETVYRLVLLTHALDLILVDEDYSGAKALMEECYPPGSPRDLRILVYATGQVFLACAAEDRVQLKQATLRMYQIGKNFQSPIGSYALLSATQFALRDSQLERAAEWLGAFEQTPGYRMAMIWPWYQRFRARLVAASGQAAFDDAYRHGSKRGYAEVAEEAVTYIETHSSTYDSGG
jgi:hypothetical protein